MCKRFYIIVKYSKERCKLESLPFEFMILFIEVRVNASKGVCGNRPNVHFFFKLKLNLMHNTRNILSEFSKSSILSFILLTPPTPKCTAAITAPWISAAPTRRRHLGNHLQRACLRELLYPVNC